jgi:hypothetical protein
MTPREKQLLEACKSALAGFRGLYDAYKKCQCVLEDIEGIEALEAVFQDERFWPLTQLRDAISECGEDPTETTPPIPRTRRDDDDYDEYEFTLSGVILVTRDAEPQLDVDGNICAFHLPDGRRVTLAVALEVEDVGIKYITDQEEMETLGFCFVDYLETRFDLVEGDGT